MTSFFKKYARFIWFIAITVMLVWGFFTWRQLLLPFFIGLVLAYLLLPIVRWVEKYLPGNDPRWQGFKRIAAIIIVTIAILATFSLVIYFSASAIVHSSSDLIGNASHFIDTAIARIQEWIDKVSARMPDEWRQALDNVTANLGETINKAVQGLFAGGGSMVTSSLGVIFSFAALPLFLFYLLKDAERMKKGILENLPPKAALHTSNIFDIIERTLGRYFRAALILGTVVGLMTLIGMLFIEPRVAIPLAIINGLLEVVPTFGPIIGGIIMAIVILATAPEQLLWVILLAFVVQLLENNILVPRIQAANFHLHPALVLFILVAGSYFWGFWGLLFAVPVSATLIDIFKYLLSMNPEIMNTGISATTGKFRKS